MKCKTKFTADDNYT